MRSSLFTFFSCFSCIALLFARNACAQSATLSLDDAVAQAVERNPRLSAAVRDIAAARHGVQAARARSNPEVVFSPGFTAGGTDEEFRIQQPLEINGTRSARAGVAEARLDESRAQAVIELRDLVFATKSAYYELARARELHAVARDLLESATEFDRIARVQVEAGARPGIDLAQTGIEVTRARQQVTIARSREVAAQAALDALLGRDSREPVGALSPLPTAHETINEDAAIAAALASRTEIALEEAGREGFLQEARLARAEGRPDIAPLFRADSLTRRGGESGFGVAVTLPFLDYGSRRERIRQAEESARAREERGRAVRAQVRQEVVESLARLDADRELIESYREGILDQSRRLLDAGRIGFQEGQVGVIALLEARRTYRNVQTEYTNALADAAIARAALERAVGGVPASLLPESERGAGEVPSK